jgi:hypothetical protein
VSYTPPSLTPSGVTWTSLRALGARGTFAQVAQVNNMAPALADRLRSPDAVAGAVRAYTELVGRFVAGDPIDITEATNRAIDFSKVFHALAQAADDINALIVANPGTLKDVFIHPTGSGTSAAGQFAQRRRTWP